MSNMRRRWFVGGALASVAALVPGLADAKKKKKQPRAPEPETTLAAKVKALDAKVRELERRLEGGGL